MSVYLLDQSLDVGFLAVKVELLAILCVLVRHCSLTAELQGNVLNFTRRELGSVEFRGRTVDVIVVPLARAFGGMNVRKRRAGFAHVENGLNLAETSVINLVIILKAEAEVQREEYWAQLVD